MSATRMPVYLDYAATTPVDPRVAARMARVPDARRASSAIPASASHALRRARRRAGRGGARAGGGERRRRAAEVVLDLGRHRGEQPGDFRRRRSTTADCGRHIVTARTEHKAVLDPCRELERRGWQVTYLVPDARRRARARRRSPRRCAPDTVLVSIMHVNNEIGVIQDIARDRRDLRAARRRAAARRCGAKRRQVRAWILPSLGVDLMSLSAHKAYGPKGVGRAAGLARRPRRCNCTPLQFGGGQERGAALRAPWRRTRWWAWGWRSSSRAQHCAAERARIAPLRRALVAGTGSRSAACCATATAPRCGAARCSTCRSRGWRARACWRRCARTSRCRRARPAHRRMQEPSYVLRALGRDERLEREQPALRFGALHQRGATSIRRSRSVTRRPSTRLRRIARRVKYNEFTRRYFESRARRRRARRAPTYCRGAAGSRAQGTWVQFDLQVGAGDRSTAARFLAFGCPHTIAVAAGWPSRRSGQPPEPRLPESVQALRERFAVPVEKLGRLLIIEDAWLARECAGGHLASTGGLRPPLQALRLSRASSCKKTRSGSVREARGACYV